MELKIDNWNKMSIKDYCKIQEYANNKEMEAFDVEVGFISVLCGVSEEEILNLPVPEFQRLRSQGQFIAEFPETKAKAPKKLILNNKEYEVHTDMSKIITSQYIDFQTFIKLNDLNKYLPNILACFIVPKGCQYGDGNYDMDELIEDIRNELGVLTAMEMCNFFMKAFLSYMDAILRYSEKKMRKATSKMDKEKTKEIMEKIKEVRLMIDGAGFQQLTQYQKPLENHGR